MSQSVLMEAFRCSNLIRAVALASMAGTGCGGDVDASTADVADQAGANQSESDDASSGIEPAPAAHAAAAPGEIIANPGVPEPQAEPSSPLPTEVQVTNTAVRVNAGDGALGTPLFTARSPLGTTLDVVETSVRICVRGELAAVPNGDYANYWGGEVGLVLGASPPAQVAPPGEGLDTAGFTFRLTGELPLQLRVRVGAAGEVPLTSQYCRDVATSSAVSVQVTLNSLTFECWGYDGAAYPAGARATLLSWQIPANPETATSFDFCIEDITALP